MSLYYVNCLKNGGLSYFKIKLRYLTEVIHDLTDELHPDRWPLPVLNGGNVNPLQRPTSIGLQTKILEIRKLH